MTPASSADRVAGSHPEKVCPVRGGSALVSVIGPGGSYWLSRCLATWAAELSG